ncbi:hypothetical protein BC938DRAFT_478711 [Jimgerdemannia flammicorona]|uniref:BTBD10/KCTD20 BTB/POZ domain-containing protein n=1 Tax=Jimgerdemannia flammicorona TaxID=994334 RepID=A0A433QMH3_9FUNG|nr:hypothetical protein BC938DRAFT_478711 [Jimgerdemannia flammicorona]
MNQDLGLDTSAALTVPCESNSPTSSASVAVPAAKSRRSSSFNSLTVPNAASHHHPSTDHDPLIALVVGNIRYDIRLSRLTSQPDTMLGTMFSSRNSDLQKPSTTGEYRFPERNGQAFAILAAFYDSDGRFPDVISFKYANPHLRFTWDNLLDECDYFQVPFTIASLYTTAYDATQARIENFLNAIVRVIQLAITDLCDVAEVRFETHADAVVWLSEDGNRGERQSPEVLYEVAPYLRSGYMFMRHERFRAKILDALTHQLKPSPRFILVVTPNSDDTWYDLDMSGILDHELLFGMLPGLPERPLAE